MAITFTFNYRDVLAKETVAYIDSLTEADYDLQPMLTFIDENSEESFMELYPIYIELGEEYGYDPVDAFLTLVTPDCLEDFTGSYIGEFDRLAYMAQDYFDDDINDIHHCIAIDWEETAENLLEHYVDRVGDFYFRSNY